MSQPFTRRVVAARLNTPAVQVIYTHSGPSILIIRDVILANLNSAPQIARLFLTTGGQNYDLFRLPAAAALTTFHEEMRQELLVGDTLSLQSDLGVLTCLITGYYLSP